MDRSQRLADRFRNVLCATVLTRDVVRLDAATFGVQPACFLSLDRLPSTQLTMTQECCKCYAVGA